MSEHRQRDDHWLARPTTVKRLWQAFMIVLAVTVLLQFRVSIEGAFPLEGTFGFAAAFGFASCIAMVILARVLGWLLKRPEDYYGEADPPAEASDD